MDHLAIKTVVNLDSLFSLVCWLTKTVQTDDSRLNDTSTTVSTCSNKDTVYLNHKDKRVSEYKKEAVRNWCQQERRGEANISIEPDPWLSWAPYFKSIRFSLVGVLHVAWNSPCVTNWKWPAISYIKLKFFIKMFTFIPMNSDKQLHGNSSVG